MKTAKSKDLFGLVLFFGFLGLGLFYFFTEQYDRAACLLIMAAWVDLGDDIKELRKELKNVQSK